MTAALLWSMLSSFLQLVFCNAWNCFRVHPTHESITSGVHEQDRLTDVIPFIHGNPNTSHPNTNFSYALADRIGSDVIIWWPWLAHDQSDGCSLLFKCACRTEQCLNRTIVFCSTMSCYGYQEHNGHDDSSCRGTIDSTTVMINPKDLWLNLTLFQILFTFR